MSGAGPSTPSDPDGMTLRIKLMDNSEHHVTCSTQAKVVDLKTQMEPLCGIPVDRQRLIFRGELLVDSNKLKDAHVEDGFTLHLVERAAAPPNLGPPQPGEQAHQRQSQRISVNMVDADGVMPGGIPGLIERLAGQLNGEMHMITHPIIGNQEAAAQVVQLVAVTGGPQVPRGAHQLTALNNFLLTLENQETANGNHGPPFSIVTRLGQEARDQTALRDVALASLNGVELPESLAELLQEVRRSPEDSVQPQEPAAPDAAEATGERDPRRNGLDAQSRPRALPLSTNLLRLSTLALSQIVSQSTRHLQSAVLPGLAQSVQSLRDLAGQSSPDGQQIAEQARRLSNSAYNVGSLLLELSLAATNLSQAASGNGGPLLSAQTGFLSTDGSHPHITNRVPSGPPAMDPNMPRAQLQRPVAPGPLRSTGTNPGARPSPGGDTLQGGPQAQPSPGGPEVTGQPQPPQPAVPGRGRDSSSPFAHAFFNAITSEGDSPSRHMRLPLRLGEGSEFRLDMSYIINAIEVFLLSIPPERLSRILVDINPELRGGTMRTQMLTAQSDDIRRQIFERFAGPILDTLLPTIRSYFEQVYRIRPVLSRAEQPAIRPTTRARSRTVPSLTHPYATIPNPARAALLASAGQAGPPLPFGMLPPGGSLGTIVGPGGQVMHLQMSMDQVQLQDLQAAMGGLQVPDPRQQRQDTQHQVPQQAGIPQRPPPHPAAAPPPGQPPLSQASLQAQAEAQLSLARQLAPLAAQAIPMPGGSTSASAAPPSAAGPGSGPQSGGAEQPSIPGFPAPFAVYPPSVREGASPLDAVAQQILDPIQAAYLASQAPGALPGGPRQAASGARPAVRVAPAQVRSALPSEPVSPLSGSDLEQLATLCTNHPTVVQAFLRAQRRPSSGSGSSDSLRSMRGFLTTNPRSSQPSSSQRGSSPSQPGTTEQASRQTQHTTAQPEQPASDTSTSSPGGGQAPDNQACSSQAAGARQATASGIAPQLPGGITRSERAAGESVSKGSESRPTPSALPKLPPRKRPSSGSQKADKTPAEAKRPREQSRTAEQNEPSSIPPRASHAGTSARATDPQPSLQGSLQHLLNNPGQLDAIMNSPQFMSLAESPAVDRMLQRVFPGASLDTPVLGVDGNTVSVDPRGDGGSMTADMGSMFQALMPIAQQVMQGLQGGQPAPSSSRSASAAPVQESQQPQSSSDGFPELARLLAEERRSWRQTILEDRRIQEQQADRKLSEKYFQATGRKQKESEEGSDTLRQ